MSETPTRAVAAPDKRDSRPIREVAKLDDLLTNDQFRKSLARAVAGTMTPQRILSTFAGALRKSPELRQCNVLDVAGKVLAIANVGLEPDSPLQQAHLIPFKESRWNPESRKRELVYVCQVVFGYRGLLDLAFRSGLVGAVRAEVVWRDEEEAGAFAHEYGTAQYLRHKKLGREHLYDPVRQAAGTAEYPTWAYAYATLKGTDQVSFEAMPWSDIKRVRDNSPAFRSAQYFMEEAKKDGKGVPTIWHKAPWVEHLPRMAVKTAFRLFSNWIPRSVEFASALALDEAGDRHALDLGPIVDLDTSHYAEAAVDAAGESGDPGVAYGDRREGNEGSMERQSGTEDARPEQQREAPATQPRQERAPAPRKVAAKKAAAPPTDEPPPGWDEDGGQPASSATPPANPARTGENPRGEPAAAPASEAIEQAAPDAVPFDEWLLDASGDTVGEQPYDDPAAYARALMSEVTVYPAGRQAMIEHNSGAIENARQASDEAARILSALDADGASDDTPEIVAIPLVVERGKPAVGAYFNAFKADTARQTAASLLDFIAANMPTLVTVPQSTRVLCIAELAKKAQQFGITMPVIPMGPATATQPPANPAPPATAAQPQEDPDWKTARNRVSDMETFTDLNEFLDYCQRGIVMKKLIERLEAENKPEILDWMRAQAERIRMKLGGKPTA